MKEAAGRLTIRQVSHGSAAWRATVRLRDAVLRRPLGLRFEPGQLAAEWDSVHLAAFLDGRLAGCLVLTPLDARRVRMRQVAVRPELQGRGVGTRLVRRSESVAVRLGFRSMVLHARMSAVPFYRRLGYRVTGPEFVEVGLPHRAMRKPLAPAAGRPIDSDGGAGVGGCGPRRGDTPVAPVSAESCAAEPLIASPASTKAGSRSC